MATYKELDEAVGNGTMHPRVRCYACSGSRMEQATILMWGYGETDLELCTKCATQLARKLLEDVCACNGARHG